MATRIYEAKPKLIPKKPYLPQCRKCLYYTNGDKVCNHLILTGERRIYDPSNPEHNCGSWEKNDLARRRAMLREATKLNMEMAACCGS